MRNTRACVQSALPADGRAGALSRRPRAAVVTDCSTKNKSRAILKR